MYANTSERLKVDAITHDYGSRRALDAVSFTARAGEILALLGPNGSGKTTLFAILATLLRPSAGAATICGHDLLREPSAVRRALGVVFQKPTIDLSLTARENLECAAMLYGLRGAERHARVDEMLERVALTDRAEDRAGKFSGGMQRRLELAKGMLHRPQLLLLDEPSTGLDPGARADLWHQLAILRDEGAAILVTTHLMEEAERCDRVAILSRGKLVALDSPASLKASLGAGILTLEARSPEDALRLAERLRSSYQLNVSVAEKHLRVERDEPHRFVTELVESFPGEFASVTFSEPSLEDVFIERTGHRFWREEEEAGQ